MTERLDKMGLSRLWRAIQYNLINKQDILIPGQGVNITDNVISCTSSGGGSGSIDSVYYGKCLSLSEDSTKIVNISGFSLQDGQIVNVLFENGNSYSTNPGTLKLNINDTGAKSIMINGSVVSSSNKLDLSSGELATFIYDSLYESFQFLGRSGLQTDSNKIFYGKCSTSAGTFNKVVVCPKFSLQDGQLINILFSTANTVSNGSITLNINDTGAKGVLNYGHTFETTSGGYGNYYKRWEANTVISVIYEASTDKYVLVNTGSGYSQYSISGGTYSFSGYVYKSDNMATLVGSSITGSGLSTGNTYTIAVLPEEYRPVLGVEGPAFYVNGQLMKVALSSSGQISIFIPNNVTINSGSNILSFTLTYAVK